MSHLRDEIRPDDHVAGPSDAPITLLEYGDYECPFCGRAYWEVKRLQKTLGHRMRFVFRNFPLAETHPHAELAAEAAEAADAQGRFWEMHDMLYEHQTMLDPQSILSYAFELGLDMQRFSDDLEGQRFRARVHHDFMGGARSGVNGTPTFFINGVRYDGDFSADTLLTAIHGVLSKEGGPTAHGF